MKTRTVVLALALLAFVAGGFSPTLASAAGWGKGSFSGKVRGQFGPRPVTNVVLSARGSKVRIVNLGLSLDCRDDNQFGLPVHFKTLVSSRAFPVREGAAGGGAILRFKMVKKYRGKSYPIRVEAFLGLRDDYIQGTIDAEVSKGVNLQDCSDSGIFTARK